MTERCRNCFFAKPMATMQIGQESVICYGAPPSAMPARLVDPNIPASAVAALRPVLPAKDRACGAWHCQHCGAPLFTQQCLSPPDIGNCPIRPELDSSAK